jgi:hypothetical protein
MGPIAAILQFELDQLGDERRVSGKLVFFQELLDGNGFVTTQPRFKVVAISVDLFKFHC